MGDPEESGEVAGELLGTVLSPFGARFGFYNFPHGLRRGLILPPLRGCFVARYNSCKTRVETLALKLRHPKI